MMLTGAIMDVLFQTYLFLSPREVVVQFLLEAGAIILANN